MKKTMLVLALAVAPAALADAPPLVKMKPGMYHTVATAEMVGLPMKPPAHVTDRCVTPEEANNPKNLAQNNPNCQETAFKTTGNKATFQVVCHERGETQTGTGEYTFAGDHMTGVVTVEGSTPMGPLKIVTHIESKRTGDCPAPAKK
jgi:hypothetical protein